MVTATETARRKAAMSIFTGTNSAVNKALTGGTRQTVAPSNGGTSMSGMGSPLTSSGTAVPRTAAPGAIPQVLTPGFTNAGRRDPFFTPTRFDTTGGNGYATTPVIGGAGGYLETNPDVTYNRYLASQGIGQSNLSNYAQFARQQYNNSLLGYKSALADSPNLTLQRYLLSLGGDAQFRRMFSAQTPRQRGESNAVGGPTRTIADL